MSEHHHHHHHHRPASGKVLYLALILTLGFAIVEFIGGWVANSLALMGDAGHMLTDAGALLIAVIANWLSKKSPTSTYSYGLLRAEVVAALINGLLMLLIISHLVSASFERFQQPAQVDGLTVIIIAALGLIINLAVAYILNSGEKNISTRAALLHVMADLLGSIAALTSGIVIYFTDWMVIDPILTLVICVLVLFSTYHLLKEVLQIIMEAVPSHLNLDEVGLKMASIDHVSSVHDLHIWTLSSGKIALSAHIVLKDMSSWEKVLAETKTTLNKTFHIEHVTLQPELIEAKPIYPCDVKNEFESSESRL